MANLKWPPIIERAAAIVGSYDTGVTLRQLFYRLVADGTLPNLDGYYRRLSSATAEARRDGEFPDLLDLTSRIERHVTFDSPAAAHRLIRDLYRRDRTEGQEWTVYLGVEKAGMAAQLDAWFGDPFGFPIVALGGYASQSLVDKVARDIVDGDRPAVLVYAGDHDPTGIDIDRDFEARVGEFDKVIRVALSAEQVTDYALPHNSDPKVLKKIANDPRAAAFVRRHGSLVQYELDALDPAQLRDLYRNPIDGFHDPDAYADVMAEEAADRAEVAGWA